MPNCINCKGAHPANARSCPKWKEEKQVQFIKVTQNISFQEARKQVTPSQHLSKSFASVVRPSSTRCMQTQTDISISPSSTFSDFVRSFTEPVVAKPVATQKAATTNTPVSLSKMAAAGTSKSSPTKASLLRNSAKKGQGAKKPNKKPLSKSILANKNRFSRLESEDDDPDDEEAMQTEFEASENPRPKIDRSRLFPTKPSSQ